MPVYPILRPEMAKIYSKRKQRTALLVNPPCVQIDLDRWTTRFVLCAFSENPPNFPQKPTSLIRMMSAPRDGDVVSRCASLDFTIILVPLIPDSKNVCNEYFIGDVTLCSQIYSLNPSECGNNTDRVYWPGRRLFIIIIVQFLEFLIITPVNDPRVDFLKRHEIPQLSDPK